MDGSVDRHGHLTCGAGALHKDIRQNWCIHGTSTGTVFTPGQTRLGQTDSVDGGSEKLTLCNKAILQELQELAQSEAQDCGTLKHV